MPATFNVFVFPGSAASFQDLTVDATKSCTASGTNVLLMASSGGIEDGAVVDGPGVPAGTVVNAHTGVSVTCSNNITAGSEPQNRTFANRVGNPWTAISNSIASDGSTADCAIPLNSVNGGLSERVVWSAYPTTAIPDGVNVIGLLLDIERLATAASSGITDASVRLRLAGVAVGDEKANTGLLGSGMWGTSDEVNSYGGDGDTWGVIVEDGDLRDSGFGFELTCQAPSYDSAGETASIDSTDCLVFYQVPSSTLTLMGVGAAIATAGAALWAASLALPGALAAIAILACASWRGRTRCARISLRRAVPA